MFKRFICITIFSLFFIIPATASAIGFEASVGIWYQEPEGYVSYKPVTSSDRLDIERDLKYDSETKGFVRLKVYLPPLFPDIYIMATPVKFEAEGKKDVQFNFDDKTFDLGIPFTSTVSLSHYDLAFYYSIPFLRTATLEKLNAEVGLNARFIDFDAKVRQEQSGTLISASKSAFIPVPMIYIGAQIKPVSFFALELEARGIAYGSSHYYDLTGRLKIKPYKMIFVSGGYRYEDFKIDYQDIDSKIKIKGPFAEAGIEF